MDPPALRRRLGYWDLLGYGMAYVAPIAPLSTLGFVWNASGGLLVLAYLLGALAMYFTAKSYALMTEAQPLAGSVYAFARLGLGQFAGFFAGWMILLDYLLVPALLYALAAVAMSTLLPVVPRPLWIVLSFSVTFGINWFGIQVTTRANFFFLALQGLMLLAFLGFALAALHSGKGHGALTLKPVFDAGLFDASKVFAGTSICLLSFLGFDAISTLSEEARDQSGRTVGRAIIGTLVATTLIFAAQTWIIGNLMPGFAIKDAAAAAFELADWAIGAWFAVIMAWVIALTNGFSNPVPMQAGVARVVFAMGRDRQLPGVLAAVHPRHGTPYAAMIATGILSLGVALAMQARIDDLASIVNFGALIGFTLLHVSVIAHFGFRRGSRDFFRHWLVPIAGLTVVLAVLTGMSRIALVGGGLWMAAGLVYGLVLRLRPQDGITAKTV